MISLSGTAIIREAIMRADWFYDVIEAIFQALPYLFG